MPEVIGSNEALFEDAGGETNTPHAGLARTLASALNYTFEVAIADLIDNSIANGAENVWVYAEHKNGVYESPRAFVAVVDDGDGLGNQDLIDKLGYGYKSDDDSKNLGAFGLGLKTASSSQSWIVAVASRQSPEDDFFRRAWDIPWIDNKSKWKLRIPKEEIFPEKIMETISSSSGTVVLLPDLTRMKSNMDELSGYHQAQVLAKKSSFCAVYLQVVFHRFISGKCLSDEYSGSKLNIFINGEKLEPWDPFMEDHDDHQRFTLPPDLPLTHLSASSESDSEVLSLTLHERSLQFRMHILPKLEEWSLDFMNASGIKGWVAMQGVYFYRLDRMIQMGGWCGLVKNEVKNQLARLSIDAGREWDQLIELTAVKDRIIVPETEDQNFRKDFRKIFGKHRSAARNVYEADYGQEGDSDDDDSGSDDDDSGSDGGGSTSGGSGGTTRRRRRRRRLDDRTVKKLLEACENDEEEAVVTRVYTRAQRTAR